MKDYILPVVSYRGRQRPNESPTSWKARCRNDRGRQLLATQVIHNDTLWVGAVHVQAWLDFCGGVLVSSAKIQEISDKGLGYSFANFGLTVDEVDTARPHIPHLAPELDPYEVIARSLRTAILTYCFEKRRRMMAWVDKQDGRLSQIMDGIEGTHWTPELLVSTRAWVRSEENTEAGEWVDGCVYLTNTDSQALVGVTVNEQAPFRNINSGNDCALTWCELDIPADEDACGDCGENLYGGDSCDECGGVSHHDPSMWRRNAGNVMDYPILQPGDTGRGDRKGLSEWWRSLPHTEFNNG